MIKILEATKGELIAIKVEGKVTQEDFNVFNPVLEKTIKDFEKPKIYIEIHEIDPPSFQAIWADLSNIPYYNKLEKCAVVGTKDWYEPMTKFFGKIISPEVKYFDFDQRAEAMQWLKLFSYHENH